MGYVDSNLMPGETVVHRAKLHWFRYFWTAAWLLIAIVLFAASASGAGAVALILAVALGVGATLDVLTSEFVVTNKRLYLKVGIIRRRSTELLLSKVESVQIDQSIAGRIFGFGSIIPGGSGGTKQEFQRISDPMILRQRANEQIEAAGQRG